MTWLSPGAPTTTARSSPGLNWARDATATYMCPKAFGLPSLPLKTNPQGHGNKTGVSARREHAVVTGLGENLDIAVLAKAEGEAGAKIHAGPEELFRSHQFKPGSGGVR